MTSLRRAGAASAACALAMVCLSPGTVRAAAPQAEEENTWKKPPEGKTKRPPPPEWRKKRIDSRLVIAVSPTVGPHAFGNEQCNSDQALCDRAGRFLALGATVEARARLFKLLYFHARFLAAGNAIGHKPVFAGVLAPGAGIGVYGKLAFIRGEYMFVVPLGGGGCDTLETSGAQACNDFEVPFSTERGGEAAWSNSAGMISGGLRYRLRPRMVGEVWGGVVVGPRERRLLFDERENRVLTSFVVGIGLAFDAVR